MKKEISKALNDVKAELEGIRQKVADLNAEHDRLTSRDVSFEERRAALYQEIDDRATAGRERFFGAAHVDDLSNTRARQTLPDLLGVGAVDRYHLMEFFCCAFNRELKENLAQALQTVWPSDAMNSEERKQRLEKIEAEKLQLERTEEGIVVELEGLGVEVERRPTLSPAVFLEAKE